MARNTLLRLLMISLAVFSVWGCTPMLMNKLDVRPSKTSITYGQTNTTNDTVKDAKNDSTTTADTTKESWTIRQDFVWGKEK